MAGGVMSVAIITSEIERHLRNRRSLGLHWDDQSGVQSDADGEGGTA
jgi:hypothetical protein